MASNDPSPVAAGSRDGIAPAANAERLLAELVRETLVERRRARRWSIFFRALFLVGFAALALALLLGREMTGRLGADRAEEGGGHTALIRVGGVIAPSRTASIEPVRDALEAALDDEETRGVIVHVDSPGGSPVQSGLIHDAILAVRAEHPNRPVHAVLGDVAASGGYYVAVAAERIHANRASIVGSIGVRLDGFGAVEAIERLGLERRLLVAGEHKGLLDPFEPTDPVAVARLQTMIDNVHAQFVTAVREGRGERLADDPTLFSGLVWSGEEALGNGLVDALGDVRSVAAEVIGAPRVVDYTERPDPLKLLRRGLGAVLEATLDALGLGPSSDASVPSWSR